MSYLRAHTATVPSPWSCSSVNYSKCILSLRWELIWLNARFFKGGEKQMITASWSNQPGRLRYPGMVSVLPGINYWVCLLSSTPSRSRSSFPFHVLCSRIVLQGRIGRHTVSCQQRCHIVWNCTKWNRSQLGKSSLIPACSPLTVKPPLKDASFTNERQVQSQMMVVPWAAIIP